jgi:hypothetical protein
MEPTMAYFILFLFVAYVAPVLFLKGLERYAASQSVERERPSEKPEKSLVSASSLTPNI